MCAASATPVWLVQTETGGVVVGCKKKHTQKKAKTSRHTHVCARGRVGGLDDVISATRPVGLVESARVTIGTRCLVFHPLWTVGGERFG